MTGLIVLAVVLVAALAVAALIRARSGKVRATAGPGDAAPAGSDLLRAAGVPAAGPTVLHFSADWCGPCAAVRRVVERTLVTVGAQLPDGTPQPVDLELDIDENPELARELGVLSLPTTFVFDSAGVQRFRVSGVPTAADLEAALVPLCRPEGSHPDETR